MRRFDFVLFIFSFLFLAIAPCQAQIFNVRKYGAKGDGKADDYKAILAAVGDLNKKGTGTLYFPKGTYYIAAYHTKERPVADIVIQNCNDLRIYGEQATIRVNGKFHRPVDYTSGKHSYSKTSSVIPLILKNCRDVVIENLEISGEVNLMTRAKNLTEFGGHLLSIHNSSNVVAKNLYVHHAQTDGVYITGKSSGFRFDNVRSANNARQGMSIIELKDAQFTNCQFVETGYTGGKYGGHAPRAGVDIEPGPKQQVSNIAFEKCSFVNNAGSQFVASRPSRTQGVRINNSTLRSEKGSYPYQIILNVKNMTISNSTLDLGKGSLYPVWGSHVGSSSEIVNCVITSSGKGIVAVTKELTNQVTLKGNRLQYAGASLNSYFPYIQMANLKFIDNDVKIPSSVIKKGKITSLIQKAEVSSGNQFRTEHLKVKPKVSYQGTRSVKDK